MPVITLQELDRVSSNRKSGPFLIKKGPLLFCLLLLLTAFAQAAPRAYSLEHRLEGVLLGQSFGDAWGAPYEMYSPSEIESVFGGVHMGILPTQPIQRIFQAKGREQYYWLRKPGFYTDDTQQALALLTVVFNEQKDQLADSCWSERHTQQWARLIVDGFHAQSWRGYGKKFKAAATQLEKTVSSDGQYNLLVGTPSAGVGAAMRVAPLGALFFEPAQELCLRRAVMESSLVTHRDMRAAATAYAIAYLSAAIIRGDSIDRIAHQLPFAIERAEVEYGERRQSPWAAKGILDPQSIFATSIQLSKLLQKLKVLTNHWTHSVDLNEVSAAVLGLANEGFAVTGAGAPLTDVNDAFSFASGFHALALAMVAVNAHRNGEAIDPIPVIKHAISKGGDADTVAAILGGLLGAHFGVRWIQKTGAHKMLPQSVNQYSKMIKAFRKGFVPESTKISYSDFLAAEAQLTAEEKRYQQSALDQCEEILTNTKMKL